MENYFIGHVIGDWLLQNDWMAKNKPSRGIALWAHVGIVTLATSLVTGWWDIRGILAFAAHFLIDGFGLAAVWMKLYRQTDLLWLRFVIDQCLHLVSLWAIAEFV